MVAGPAHGVSVNPLVFAWRSVATFLQFVSRQGAPRSVLNGTPLFRFAV
jgi:hypothetical protein